MENPSYYAVLPADVRYDTRLTPNSKLLFAEITSLCNNNGKCNASNKYFSKLYSVSNVSISKWVSQLVEFGYIRTNIVYKKDSKEILYREIELNVEDSIVQKEEEKVKIEKDVIDFDMLLKFFNSVTGKKVKVVNEKAKRQFRARINDGYTKADISKAILNCFNDKYHKENPQYLTLEFISRADKLEKYCSIESNVLTKEEASKKKILELKKSMGI